MKKLSLIAAILAVVLIGCSDKGSPSGPSQTSGAVAASHDLTVGPPSAGFNMVESTTPDPNVLTVSQKVVAKTGGTVTLTGSYTKTTGVKVTYLLYIRFAAGDLPSDQTITISINKTTFAQNADVTFGPAGLVFKNPATLYVGGSGIDIALANTKVTLQYWNNTAWVAMGSSWGYYTTNFTGVVLATGKIPHFSRYAFGR